MYNFVGMFFCKEKIFRNDYNKVHRWQRPVGAVMVLCVFLPCFLEGTFMTAACNGGGQSFYYLKVGEEQVLFIHPSEADWILIGEEYPCPQ